VIEEDAINGIYLQNARVISALVQKAGSTAKKLEAAAQQTIFTASRS
jgi:hypothetical protein